MKFYLRYCCAMCFALISFLLAPPQRAQARTREAYVRRSADETTLTFYYDALRSTRTGTTWGIEETKKKGDDTFAVWAGTSDEPDRITTRVVFDASFRDFRPTTTARWGSTIIVHSSRSKGWNISTLQKRKTCLRCSLIARL